MSDITGLYTVHYQKSDNVFGFRRFTNEIRASMFAVFIAVEMGYYNIHTGITKVIR
jgi:hypothetical protein